MASGSHGVWRKASWSDRATLSKCASTDSVKVSMDSKTCVISKRSWSLDGMTNFFSCRLGNECCSCSHFQIVAASLSFEAAGWCRYHHVIMSIRLKVSLPDRSLYLSASEPRLQCWRGAAFLGRHNDGAFSLCFICSQVM